MEFPDLDSRRMKAKGKKRTPCKILTLFICVTLYLYIHISFRHVMSYSSFCHYTIGVLSETTPVDHAITKYPIQINNQHSHHLLIPRKLSKPEQIPNPAIENCSFVPETKIANRPGNQQHLQQRQRKNQNIPVRHVVTLSSFSFQFVSRTRTRARTRTRNGRPAGV